MRFLDEDGEPLSWRHTSTLSEAREEFDAEIGQTEAEVQKYDRRAEHYVPYGTLRRVRLNSKPHDYRAKTVLSRRATSATHEEN
jgi:hypothetical protein